MRQSSRNDQTASFDMGSLVTPKHNGSDTKTSPRSPPRSAEFNLKETNSDEEEEKCAEV